jgi:hypothetical protein
MSKYRFQVKNLIIEIVLENYDPRMYFGWWYSTPDPDHPNVRYRADAQFVAISWELMEQILEKPYCHRSRDGTKCNAKNPELR